MATWRELTKAYTGEYQRASKKTKGVMLTELVAATGWSRVNARRAIRQATQQEAAPDQPRRPRKRKYSDDALVVLTEVWTLSGEPCGKYLVAVMDDTVERLVRFNELGKVADRVTPRVLEELKAMSPATIDRYLAPAKAARNPPVTSASLEWFA